MLEVCGLILNLCSGTRGWQRKKEENYNKDQESSLIVRLEFTLAHSQKSQDSKHNRHYPPGQKLPVLGQQ